MKKLKFSTVVLLVMAFGVAIAWLVAYCNNNGFNVTEDNVVKFVFLVAMSLLSVISMWRLAKGVDNWEETYKK